MDLAQKQTLARLIRQQRWAALATASSDATPLAAMVAYAFDEDFSGFYIHVSQLSQHTRHMLANPKASLVISAVDKHDDDPQTLPRVSLSGSVSALARDSADYDRARRLYLHRLPTATPLFDFTDFVLFRLTVDSVRFVGGFAQARSLGVKTLTECAAITE